MTKAVFGEYSAFTTKNSIRFQKNNKLVSEKSLPPEVIDYLTRSLGQARSVEPKFPMPTEEEKARLRAESLQVPQELQGVNTDVTEEDLTKPLTIEDFENEYEPMAETSKAHIIHAQGLPTDDVPAVGVDSDFLESVSIHTAPLVDIAEALYNRFGLYTVYLNRLPVNDEINPLTGEMFTKYHLGIAYQAAIRAQYTGVGNPEQKRQQMDAGRQASENFQVDPVPATVGEARRANNFDFRTSVRGTETIPTTEIVHEVDSEGVIHAVQREIPPERRGSVNGASTRYDASEDEPIVEPNFSGKPVIRPNW